MIKIVSNTLGSGDWIRILNTDGTVLFEGHSLGIYDLKRLLNTVTEDGCEVDEVTDEDIL